MNGDLLFHEEWFVKKKKKKKQGKSLKLLAVQFLPPKITEREKCFYFSEVPCFLLLDSEAQNKTWGWSLHIGPQSCMKLCETLDKLLELWPLFWIQRPATGHYSKPEMSHKNPFRKQIHHLISSSGKKRKTNKQLRWNPVRFNLFFPNLVLRTYLKNWPHYSTC